MDNNELNRRVRYALALDDAEAVRLMALGGSTVTAYMAAAHRCKEEEPGFQACPDDLLLALLAGLVLDRRGVPPGQNADPGSPDINKKTETSYSMVMDNNTVLKQLRIALSLRTEQVQELIVAGGGKLGKSEVGAFFRKSDARNYRRCGDQVIRWFLSGLAERRNV